MDLEEQHKEIVRLLTKIEENTRGSKDGSFTNEGLLERVEDSAVEAST
jgi:hypothetical protein